jgi:Spy/CpxP family protein refolding chaperone
VRKWTAVVLLSAVLVGLLATTSFSGPGWGRRGGGWWMATPEPITGVGLTDEQKSKISALRKEFLEKQAKLMVEAQRIKADLMELRLAEKPDVEKIIAKTRELMELRMKLAEEGIRFQEKVMSVLTKEQKEKLRSLRFMGRPGLRGGAWPGPGMMGPCWWM